MIQELAEPLARIGAANIVSEGSESDVGILRRDNVPTMALVDDGTKIFLGTTTLTGIRWIIGPARTQRLRCRHGGHGLASG